MRLIVTDSVVIILSVCWSRPSAVQKRPNRLRCRLWDRTAWAQETMCQMTDRIPSCMKHFRGTCTRHPWTTEASSLLARRTQPIARSNLLINTTLFAIGSHKTLNNYREKHKWKNGQIRHSQHSDIRKYIGLRLTDRLYIRWSDVTESIATIRSPFCGYNMT